MYPYPAGKGKLLVLCLISLLVLSGGLTACRPKDTFRSLEDYLVYLNDPNNGYTQTVTSGDYKITVKYLPPTLQGINELKYISFSAEQLDSVSRGYEESLSFSVSVQPNLPNISLRQLLHRNVTDKAGVDRNMETLHYGMEPFVLVKYKTEAYSPRLHLLESTFEMDQVLRFIFVFDNAIGMSAVDGEPLVFYLKQNFFLKEPIGFSFDPARLNTPPKLISQLSK